MRKQMQIWSSLGWLFVYLLGFLVFSSREFSSYSIISDGGASRPLNRRQNLQNVVYSTWPYTTANDAQLES